MGQEGRACWRVLEGQQAFNISALTVTRVETSPDLRQAIVYVSVRGQPDQVRNIMAALKRHRGEIQNIVGQKIILKYTPRLSFELDTSVERGDHVLSVLAALEREENRDAMRNPPDDDSRSP